MANKKGEGVRGVLGDLVSKREGQARQAAENAVSQLPSSIVAEPLQATAPAEQRQSEATPIHEKPIQKVRGIKGRPRARSDDASDAKVEREKITLSIAKPLREEFYMRAYAEMMQPGEYVERALRYYMENHQK